MARPAKRHDWSIPGSGGGYRPGPGLPGSPGTRGGPGAGHGAGPGSGRGTAERGAAFFAFARAWATGIVVLVVTEYLQVSLVYNNVAGSHAPGSWGGTLALVHLPNMVCIALATWAAARMHPEPHCLEPVRHAIAACAVPVAAQALTLAVERHRPGFDTLAVCMSTGVLITGCAIGWAAERWLRPAD